MKWFDLLVGGGCFDDHLTWPGLAFVGSGGVVSTSLSLWWGLNKGIIIF